MRKSKRRNLNPKIIFCLAICAVVALLGFFCLPVFRENEAKALSIPDGYALDVDDTFGEDRNNTYKGIEKVANETNVYNVYGKEGMVTLARTSQNNSFEGYTFRLFDDGNDLIELTAVANDLTGFFGIGSESSPFKATLKRADTPGALSVIMSGWTYLFNYASNEAKILVSDQYKQPVMASQSGAFSVCDNLVVTTNNVDFDISGFQFAQNATVTQSGVAGLVASHVLGGKLSVGLSNCFSAGTATQPIVYTLQSTDGNAGGLFGEVAANTDLSVTLNSSVNLNVTANNGNAGLIVGKNSGKITLKTSGTSFTIQGTASADNSAGGIAGTNETGAEIVFSSLATLKNINVTGKNAGGIAGYSAGALTVATSTCTLSSGNEIVCTGGSAGGVIGEASVLPSGKISFGSATNPVTVNISGRGNLGGYIGKLKANTAITIENVSLLNAEFDLSTAGTTNAGGFFGMIEANAGITFNASTSPSFTFNNATSDNIGGFAGLITSNGTSDARVGVTFGSDSGTFTINNTLTALGSQGTFGGGVGIIQGFTYVKCNNVSVVNTYSDDYYVAADYVYSVEDNAFADVGNLTYKSNKSSLLVNNTGKGSVLRLSGAVKDNDSASFNHIVKRQGLSLLYADEGFSFSYPASYATQTVIGNDVGNRGQIYRNDTLEIINFDANTYTVSAAQLAMNGTEINISSESDAAKYAITIQSQGVFPFVSGVTADNYKDWNLFRGPVNLTNDINFAGTGIEQFTDSSTNSCFIGTFNGNKHKISLAIGENINGAYMAQKDGDSERRWLGLYSGGWDATVKNLTVGGKIRFTDNIFSQVCVGGIFGYAPYRFEINNCTTEIEFVFEQGTMTSSANIYAGGFVGYTYQGSGECKITIDSSNIKPVFTVSSYNNNGSVYAGGAIGNAISVTSAAFTNNKVSTIITSRIWYYEANFAGVVPVLTCADYTEIDFSGTVAEGVNISAYASVGMGGLIGRWFDKCKVKLNTKWEGTVTGSSPVGGLFSCITGKVSLESGFTFGNSVFTSLTGSSVKSGMVTVYGTATYLVVSCDSSAFENITATNNFDLFVGENVSARTSESLPASGGIVTIETLGATVTDDDLGKIPATSGWYSLLPGGGTNQKGVNNSNTRYFFNIAGLEKRNVTDGVVSNRADLIYWSVYNYIKDSIRRYVLNTDFPNSFGSSVGTATDDISVKDYCFYPVYAGSTTFKFDNHKLEFGLSNSNVRRCSQFDGLNAGIYSDIVISSEAAKTVNFGDIVLSGTVCSYSDASGVFVSGKIKGTDANKICEANIKNVFFDNLVIEDIGGTTSVRALLINAIDSFVTCNIEAVSQYTQGTYQSATKTTAYTNGTKAASSLIGYGGKASGTSSSQNITVVFKNIVFNGLKANSIFTKATLFSEINIQTGTGSYIYNFNLEEDWRNATQHINAVTYGAELSETKQQQYFNSFTVYVSPETNSATEVYGNWVNLYMPYVLTNGGNLKVNHHVYNLITGYGTYKYPYIINNAGEFTFLSETLLKSDDASSSLSADWEINYPTYQGSGAENFEKYTYGGTGTILTADNGGTLSISDLQSFLRGAYYKFGSENIEITSAEFTGIGSPSYPFHGVIVGADGGTTVKMPDYKDSEAVTETGAGFINTANGAAVYNLTIQYNAVELNASSFGGEQTSRIWESNTATATTSNVHFGGVIAWVIGGDNKIEKVNVGYETNNIKVSDLTDKFPPIFGGYVGLVSGGGVIIKDIDNKGGCRYGTDWKIPDSCANMWFFNPYVGRLINGYAFSTDKQYNNGGKGCDIPYFTTPYSSRTGRYGSNTFNFDTAEEFMMFAYAVSSGAFTVKDSYFAYGNLSRPRYGDYTNVGKETYETDIATNGEYKDDYRRDGKSIFTKYFGINDGNYRYTGFILNFGAKEYDLESYGNAFHGIGGTVYKSNVFNIKEINGTVTKNGTEETGRTKIIVKSVNKQYRNGQNVEADYIENLAFQLENKTSNYITKVNDISISGTMSLEFIDNTGATSNSSVNSKTFCVGGFVAYASSAYFKNVIADGITLKSPGWAGGLIGNQDYASGSKVNENEFTDCVIKDSTIEALQIAGGVIGDLRFYGGDKDPTIAGMSVTINNLSVVNTSVIAKRNNEYVYAGGIVGRFRIQTNLYQYKKLILNNASVSSSAVLAFGKTDKKCSAGGLFGVSQCELVLNDCFVDGCTVVASVYNTGIKSPSVAIANTKENVNAHVQYALNGVSISLKFAGGFVGRAEKDLTVSDDGGNGNYVKSSEKATVISGCAYAGGITGYSRDSTNFVFNNVNVVPGSFPIYIIGGQAAAGVFAQKSSGKVFSSVTAKDIKIGGSSDYPLYIIAASSDAYASGVFGSLATNAFTFENVEVSHTVVAADYAFGLYYKVNNNGVSLNNVNVFNNYLQGKKAVSAVINGIYGTLTINELYAGDNTIVKAGADENLGVIMNEVASGKTLSGDYILTKGNSLKYGTLKSDFSYTWFFNGTNRNDFFTSLSVSEKGGLIAYNNNGTVDIFRISSMDDLPSYGTNGGSAQALFVDYGASQIYFDVYDTSEKITITEAFEKAVYVTEDGEETHGDGVFSNNDIYSPDIINALKNWGNQITLPDGEGNSIIKPLSYYLTDVKKNTDLPVFKILWEADEAITKFLQLVTKGGYGSYDIKVVSECYSVEYDDNDSGNKGKLSKITVDGNAVKGSIDYDSTTGKFYTVEDKYDELRATAAQKTLTRLTITFSSSSKSYTMHIYVYNPPVLGINTYVSAVEGENYYIKAFTSSPAYAVSISAGSRFTLYIEYEYNEILNYYEGENRKFNYNKELRSVSADGSDQTKQLFYAETKFILFDLNSATPYGYKYYYYTLSENAYNISLSEFMNGTAGFVPKTLNVLDDFIPSSRISEKEGYNEADKTGYVFERYILVVIPDEATDNYTGKNLYLEGHVDKTSSDVLSNTTAKTCKISVWNETNVEVNVENNNTQNSEFSNTEDKSIDVDVTVNVTLPSADYVTNASQNNKILYGTHVIGIKYNGKTVRLPANTVISLVRRASDGTETVLAQYVLSADTAFITYQVGDIIAVADANKNGTYSDSFSVIADFSKVDNASFTKTFDTSGNAVYSLCDDFYISESPDFYTNGTTASATFNFTPVIENRIKIAVVPEDRKYLAINLADPSDETNSGKIIFNVSADFSSITTINAAEGAEISFAIYKKKLGEDGKYFYDTTQNLCEGDNPFGTVTRLDSEDAKMTISEDMIATGRFKLTVNNLKDLGKNDITNYMLVVTVKCSVTEGSAPENSNYFVFLLCSIDTEL